MKTLLDLVTAWQRRHLTPPPHSDQARRDAAQQRADTRDQLLARLVPHLRHERENNHFAPRIREAMRQEEW